MRKTALTMLTVLALIIGAFTTSAGASVTPTPGHTQGTPTTPTGLAGHTPVAPGTPTGKGGHGAVTGKSPLVTTGQFRVTRTKVGVTWVFACDARWDWTNGSARDSRVMMESTKCKTTRNGVTSTVKVDAVRFYFKTDQTTYAQFPEYVFGGTLSSTDDTSAAGATHTEDDGYWQMFGQHTIQMNVWGFPDAGDAAYTDAMDVYNP